MNRQISKEDGSQETLNNKQFRQLKCILLERIWIIEFEKTGPSLCFKPDRCHQVG